MLVVVASCARAWAADAEGPTAARIEHAIDRGMAWIEAHPATLADGGPRDLIDEALFYLVLQGLAREGEERDRFGQVARARLAALEGSAAFAEWVRRPRKTLLDHYHLVLAAHLMRGLGTPSAFEDPIVAQAQRALAATPRAPPTLRLTLATLLGYLGAEPPVDQATLLGRSMIARVASAAYPVPLPSSVSGVERGRIGLLFYELVHEVLALTDFGRRPLPAWLEQRRDVLGGLLGRAARWASGGENFDLLSELLVTMHLLGLPLHGAVDREVAVVVAAQRPDGTWGPCSPSRQNMERHAVLTSVAALWVYRDERAEPAR
ncbi:MAG: hypothetical protein PVF91_01935 [Chromatiales bacterium]|jgi:hypothetical protein